MIETSRTTGGGVTQDDLYSFGLLSGSTLSYGNATCTVAYSTASTTEQSRLVSSQDATSFTRSVTAYDASKRATDWSVSGGLTSTGHRSSPLCAVSPRPWC